MAMRTRAAMKRKVARKVAENVGTGFFVRYGANPAARRILEFWLKC